MDKLQMPQTRSGPRRMSPRDEDSSVIAQCKDVAWKCGACDALLGFVDGETRTIVRVKRSDFFFTVWNPDRVKTMCRRCGIENTIESEKPDDAPVEEVPPPVVAIEH